MPESFVQSYLNHTIIYETPTSFWKWSAYSTISSVLRDRCYVKDGDSYLFPNLYILLLADTSGHRKNRPVELSEKLINELQLGIKTISGRGSVQGILDELATTETDKNGKVIKSSSATFFAPELAAGIVADPEAMKILTDIYDCKANKYQHRLRTGPKFSLDRIVFSMLCASNEDMLHGLFDQAVIRGGYLARTLLIVPNEFRDPNSLLRVDYTKLKETYSSTLTQLKKVAQVHGEFHTNEEAIIEYEKWYNDFRKNYLTKKEASGIVGRIHTHIRKVAIVLAANELTQCIQRRHIEQAIDECLGLMKNYSIFTMRNAKTVIGDVGGLIVTDLLTAKNYQLSRKSIVRNHWQDFDVEIMDKAILAMEEAGMLQTLQMKDGLYYQLTPQALKILGAIE